MSGRTAGVGAAAVGLAVLVLGGCASVGRIEVPTPVAAVPAPTTTTTLAPAATVPEAAVAGSAPSTSVSVGPGSATINGTVIGPGGPVEGATVEAQRIVGDATATTEATTAADGSFTISSVLGGRWRVRAWQVPTQAETGAKIFFLAAGDTKTLSLLLTSFAGLKVTSDLNPSSPYTDQPVNLAVQVTQPTVGADGVVRQQPQASVAVVLESTSFEVDTPAGGTAMTDGNGQAIFGITCTQDGVAPITLVVGGSDTVAVAAPSCIDSDTTTTISTTTTTTTTTVAPTTAPTSPTTSIPPTPAVSVPATPPPTDAPTTDQPAPTLLP